MNAQVLAIGSLTIQIASGAQIALDDSTLTFDDPAAEAAVWGLLAPGGLVPVRFESATIADPDGRAACGPTLGVIALTDRDTAGQAFTIQFPTPEAAARVRTQILVAGALAGALALGAGAGIVAPPPAAPGSNAAVPTVPTVLPSTLLPQRIGGK